MINKIIYALMLGSMLFTCCDDEPFNDDNNRVTGTGDMTTESVTVAEFEAIDLEGVANVIIHTGMQQSVKLTTYENLHEYYEFHVVGDELMVRIKDGIRINSDEEIQLDISVNYLEKITLSGVGNFSMQGKPQDNLDIQLSGVGNVEAFDLPVKFGNIHIEGTGNVYINASETLDVDIDGMGNVYYKNSPDINQDINGLGELIQVD